MRFNIGSRGLITGRIALLTGVAIATFSAGYATAQSMLPDSRPIAPGSTMTVAPPSASRNVEIADIFHLRAAGDPQISPDGSRALFTVQYSDRVGTPYTRIWMADLKSGRSAPWGSSDGAQGSAPRWSPDGRRVAWRGGDGLMVADADSANAVAAAALDDTDTPLSRVGERFVWSPDSKRIAFVSATPGPEPEMEADPIIVTRYWYRPASGWPHRYIDNKRLHIFIVDLATRQTTQITDGIYDEHSIDWSPDGNHLAFLSNREKDPDFTFNYDIYTVDVSSRAIAQLTHTGSNEFAPSWSPDGRTIAFSGLKRPVTSSETNMEDPHVWTLDVATGKVNEVGIVVDNVQGRPQWSPDGKWLYFTTASRGGAGLYRLPARGAATAERVGPGAGVRGTVSAFSIARDGAILAAMATPDDLAQLQLFRGKGARAITSLNADILGKKIIAQTEAFTFKSYDGREIEAFLTKPANYDPAAHAAHPMIVQIHGGPHGQQGPNFAHKAQVYATRGYAVLMVNYRGSNGYGQEFANAIARDQNGGEGMDILAGVDAALARNPWIDPERLGIEGGSYGGQLTNWLVTQTTRFKAGIPWAGISNLVSHNYMSVYHDYLQQEYFMKPHEGGVMDMLWSRSPIRFVDKVKTPLMLSHGDTDLLVNPAEDEQYFIALRDVGTEAIMVRYPREGHSMRETQHLADFEARSIAWYEGHFAK